MVVKVSIEILATVVCKNKKKRTGEERSINEEIKKRATKRWVHGVDHW